jgi:hypothetical protein
MGKYFSQVVHKTQGPTGKPTLSLKINPNAVKNDKGDYKSLFGLDAEEGLSIEIPISSNARGEFINKLPRGTDFNVFDRLKRGETLKSDSFINTANFSYEVIPDSRNEPQKAKVVIRRKVKNAKTGAVEDQKPIEQWISLVGDGAKSPDEIVGQLHSLLKQHLIQNQTNSAVYQQTMKSDGKTVTYDQILQQRKQAGRSN